MRVKLLLLALISFLILNRCQGPTKPAVEPQPTHSILVPAVITQPSPNDTDDPAIWIHPVDPSLSLIIGTDKGDSTGAVMVYTLDGKIDSTRSVFNLMRPNNVDVAYGFQFAGKKIDIAVCTERGRDMIRVFSLPDMKLIDGGGIPVFEGDTARGPMGIALYTDMTSGQIHAIVSRKDGPREGYLWQYRLFEKNGVVKAQKVREFGTYSGNKEIEAIAVDNELGYIYYSDETVGVRKYHASPDSGNHELALFATTGFAQDHEGISIYKINDGKGYILVSDQQANQFQAFSREGFNGNPHDHRLLKIVKLSTNGSDGSDVTNLPLNDTFRYGMFIAMSDDRTFHFYRWEDIAGDELLVAPGGEVK